MVLWSLQQLRAPGAPQSGLEMLRFPKDPEPSLRAEGFLGLPVEPVPQNQPFFSALGVLHQAQMGNGCSVSELLRAKHNLGFTAKFSSEHKIAAWFYLFLTPLSFVFPPSAKLVFKAAAMVSLLF